MKSYCEKCKVITKHCELEKPGFLVELIASIVTRFKVKHHSNRIQCKGCGTIKLSD